MSKKKSIIWLLITMILIVSVAIFTFVPIARIGTNGVYDYVPPVQLIKLGLDLKGGVYVTFDVDTTKLDDKTLTEQQFADNISETAKSLQRRLSSKGFTESTVAYTKSGTTGHSIRVEVPDVSDSQDIFDILAKPAVLKVFMDSADSNKVAFDATNITKAAAYYDTSTSSYAVTLTMNSAGQKQISEATKDAASNPTKIFFILDGVTISDPQVSTHITGKTSSITGLGTTPEFAQTLALQINSGMYQVEFSNISEARTIGSKLGDEAINTTLFSGIITIALICIFIAIVYGLMGVAASLALVCYTLLLVLALALFPFAQLTLPGIAGIILGIGMAVDANIIIFERIKDEYRLGRTLDVSIENGFRNALSAIIDSNITTLIGAIVLYIFASGTIQGFAITLIFSIVISLFSSLVLTRLFMKFFRPFNSNPKAYSLKGAK